MENGDVEHEAPPAEPTVTYNFCHPSPPKEFISDIKSTNKLSTEQYSDLLQKVFGFIREKHSLSDISFILQQYADENQVKLSAVKRIFKNLLLIAREAARLKLSSGQLYSDLQKLGQNAESASMFCQMWKNQSEDFETPEVEDEHDIITKLVDMEWKFGVTAASSELNRVGQCFIQMKLILQKSASETKTVFVEMSLSQFYDFLHQMEKAKLKMDALHHPTS